MHCPTCSRSMSELFGVWSCGNVVCALHELVLSTEEIKSEYDFQAQEAALLDLDLNPFGPSRL